MDILGAVQPPWVAVPVETILKTCYSGHYGPGLEEAVANILQLKGYRFDLADACIVDFFVTLIWWCREQQLAVDQAVVVVDIARRLLAAVKLSRASVADSIRDLKAATADVVARANAAQPSVPSNKFADFVKFMSNMLVQHHKLWEFFFHRLHEETVICSQFSVETPPLATVPWPPPLFEGCPESFYLTYINPPKPVVERQPTVAPPPAQTAPPPPVPVVKVEKKVLLIEDEARAERELAAEKVMDLEPELLKQLVEKTSRDVAQMAEQDLMSKIRDRENALLTKINQITKSSD